MQLLSKSSREVLLASILMFIEISHLPINEGDSKVVKLSPSFLYYIFLVAKYRLLFHSPCFINELLLYKNLLWLVWVAGRRNSLKDWVG